MRVITGKSFIGLSAYMFDPKIMVFIRSPSCFHILLPLLLFWTLHRLGYDQRAFVGQTVVALVVLPLSYLVSKPQENVNWVYGFSQKQTILPAPLFVILLMLTFPTAVYLPTHLLLFRIFRPAAP